MSVSSAGSTSTVSYLQSLLQPPANSKTTGVSDPLASLFAAFSGGKADQAEADAPPDAPPSGNAGCPQFSPGMMASLIAMQGQQATNTTSLLGQFDTDGDGAISQSEFENAIGPDADKSKVDSLFSKIDSGSDGSISADELQAAIDKAQQSQAGRRHHHHHGMGGAGAPGQDGMASLLSATDLTGATTQTASNADGSTTTTISYADGTKMTMSVPAAAESSDPSKDSSGPLARMKSFLEKLMQLQSQMLAQQAQQTTTAVTV